jgi:light-regulated signal transduction histidine kinase (bacteriophytochrome)
MSAGKMGLCRHRPTFTDAFPLVLFTVFFLGNAFLGYASLSSVTSAEERRVYSLILILTANFVGLALVILSLLMVRKAMKKEQQYLYDLMEAKEGLEYKVSERTAALQHFSNELKRSNRELQDFAFVASHDLQEPLRKIRAFGDRLQQTFAENLGPQGADYINRMQMASERMSRLINDLLTFSRITTKAKPFLPVSLNKVAEEAVDDLEVAIEEARATVTIGDLPEIDADFFQIKQLFQNLIANAIKFRRPGVPLVVTVTADPPNRAQHADGQIVTIRFKDNGIGFDESFLDRIFLPFQRLHSKAEYSGTGIGLAICRRVAERHGGSLTAKSKPEAGSTFIVTLARTNQVYHVFEEQAA